MDKVLIILGIVEIFLVGLLVYNLIFESPGGWDVYNSDRWDVYNSNNYSLDELVLEFNLSEEEYIFNSFNGNEELDINSKKELVSYLSGFPFCREILNDSTRDVNNTLSRGCGVCIDISELGCKIAKARGWECYVVLNKKYNHAIMLLECPQGFCPVLSTGYLNKPKLKDFFNDGVYMIYNEETRFVNWSYYWS